MEEILVLTAIAQLSPVDPTLSIIKVVHDMGIAPSGPFADVLGNEILLESDIDASFKTYVTPYTKPPYSTPGAIKYSVLKSIADLSALTDKKDAPIALKGTSGTITCTITAPAADPSTGNTDVTPSYDLDFEFISAGQTIALSD